jgi:type IV pilus assembly protein PilY1
LNWPDTAPFPEDGQAYSEFKNGLAANRKKMVYVGANDAMLHAFDDDTGEEVFTYVPSIISSSAIGEGLHYLTESNYGHQFYVDLTPTLSDAYISSGSSKEWHTILVGGLRGGGRGLFALNVTDPDLFQEANADKLVMWEFDSDDDSDLGFTYSRPFIAYTNAGTWVAIFGNGYNDLGSGEASLFIVDIEKGVDGIWQPGDYIKISTGAGDTANRNGLATPALADVDGNGTVDRVYAGDLEGNMWAFDLESTNQSLWDVAYKSGSTPIPLFTTPPGQPISAKPVLAKHPTQPDSSSPSNAPNIMVYFGTGQYLVDADKSSTSVQSFYGVWDQGDSALVNTDLIEQTFDTSFSVKVLTRNPVDYSIDHGWYFNLPETGERAVTSPIARADTVFFNSFVPVDDPCSVGGFGFKFAVDMATGGSPLDPSFDANKDGVIDDSDMVSNGVESSTLVAVRQEGFLPEPVFIEDLAFTAETATKVKALKDIPVGRFSWQELIQ